MEKYLFLGLMETNGKGAQLMKTDFLFCTSTEKEITTFLGIFSIFLIMPNIPAN